MEILEVHMHDVDNVSSQRQVVDALVEVANLASESTVHEAEYWELYWLSGEEWLGCPWLLDKQCLILLFKCD